MSKTTLLFLAILLSIPPSRSQDLDPADVRISLDQALPIAITKAKADFPDLEKYILYSVHPRVLKGDAEGLFWEVLWEEKAFPHYKQLQVRVYMSNGSTKCFRTEKGTFQKERDKYIRNQAQRVAVGGNSRDVCSIKSDFVNPGCWRG